MKRIIFCLILVCGGSYAGLQAQVNPLSGQSAPFRVKFTPPGASEPIDIWVANVDGQLIAQGDMVIAEASELGRGAGIQIVVSGFWPSNIIPYEIERGHPDSADIVRAVNNINTTSCLRVQRRAGEPNYVQFVDDRVGICSSPVGFRTGITRINVNGCGVGAIMHEICHAAGLVHEQSRPDRDSFIRIDTSNIKPEKRHNFEMWHTRVATSPNYDFASLMHYPSNINVSSWLISGTTARVFRSRGPNAAADEALMGSAQRNARLSPTDIIALRALCSVSGMPFMSGSNAAAGTSDGIPESVVPEGSRTATVNYVFPGSDTPKPVTVDVVDGNAILDGDIVLGPVDQLGNGGRGGATIGANDGGNARRWTNCTMPYDLNSHPCADTIRRAIATLDAATNLTLRVRGTETDYIKFVTGAGYSSPVGRRGGAQNITISANGGCPASGKVIHEILHSAGLFHEQSRADRGTHVRIDTANLRPGKKHNFQTYLERGHSGSDVGPYDYGSIMHYPSRVGDSRMVFNTSTPVITSIPPGQESRMGQRRGLSQGDINTVNAIYPCGSTSAAAATGDLAVEWSVDLAPQGANYSAWDAAGAMMIAWLPPAVSINPPEIAARTEFWNQFAYNVDPKLPVFYVNWGLSKEEPRAYTPRELFNKLRTGPLLVAPGDGGNRVRVVYGMRGNGTPEGTTLLFHDPLDRDKQTFRAPNTGFSGQATYAEFLASMRAPAAGGTGGPTTLIIAYY
jgi:Astacin (Peptidase family M12A)/Papain-like cysteine protease AvrRpt2